MGKELVRTSNLLLATQSYVEKINNFAKEVNVEFSDYQKNCVVNAVRKINPILAKGGYTWQSFSVDNIVTVLQQTAFLGLNPSATPNECFYIVRKGAYDKKTRTYGDPTLEFGIEGAGNDVILRKFGQDVADIKSYIVYEGDEFTEGYMDGWEMTLPKYKRTFKTNKPEKVVYLIKKTSGEIDVQYADTQDVMKSLLANAKQNGADDKLLRQLSKLKLYDILENEKWLNYTIEKKYGNNSYKTPLFNPSYTSPISMYNMIERKLRNHATRKYPKNFNHNEVSNLYEDTFDEKYNQQGELITAEERVKIAYDEVNEKSGSEKLSSTAEKETPKPKVDDERPTLDLFEEKDENDEQGEEPETLTEEELEADIKEQEELNTTVQEKSEENTDNTDNTDNSESDNNDLPDWML